MSATNKPTIRNYNSTDRSAVLHLLELNTPTYFSPAEREDLEYYLDHEIESYFVLEFEGVIAGCGGINYSEDKKTGLISWDIIHPDYQSKGLGTLLLKHRIKILQAVNTIQKIKVRTSQLTGEFYAKSGFNTVIVIPDYWAPGFDLVEMDFKD